MKILASEKKRIEIDRENFLVLRHTPWDERNFGFHSDEIIEFTCHNPDHVGPLLELFDDYNRERGIRFSYTRINSEEKILKVRLQEKGFYYVETSLHVKKKDLQGTTYPLQARIPILLESPKDEDFPQIKEIARHDFSYGRFLEDPCIDSEKARQRYAYTVDDQREMNREFLVYKKDKEVIGFHIQSVNDGYSDMILTGTRKERSMISYYFWAAIMKDLKKRGVREAGTIISSSNIPIVNLYSYFGFKVEKTLIGFHKFYEEAVYG